MDYNDGSMSKAKGASPQRDEAVEGSIAAAAGIRAQSRAGSNTQEAPKQLGGVYMNSKIDRVLEGTLS